jgi:hypothetical protein
MSASASSAPLFRRIIKLPLRLLYIMFILILLLGAILFFLPTLVSTEGFKQLLERRATLLLHRHVQLEKLDWTWSGGIELKGLKIDDDPDFSTRPIISVESLSLKTDLSQLLKTCLDFDLSIKGLNAELIRNPDGRTNLEALLANLKGMEKQEQETRLKESGDFSLSLPFDINGHVLLEETSLQMNDHIRDRNFMARDITLLLDVPSIREQAVTLNLNMNEEIDGLSMPPVKIFLCLENMIDSDGYLSLDNAALTLNGTLPGLTIDLIGEAWASSVKGTVELDASPLATLAQPFIAATLPEVSGRIKMDLAARGNPLEDLSLSTIITGTGLYASQGPLKDIKLGPLNLRLIQEGSFSLSDGTLFINSGEIQVQDDSNIFWKGSVLGLKDPAPVADLILGPVFLDFEGLLPLVKDFIPPIVSINNEVQDTLKRPFRLELNEAKINGPLLSGSARLDLEGAKLSLPLARVKTTKGFLSAEELNFQISRANFILESAFPVQAELLGDLDIRNLNINTGKEIYLERINVPLLNLVVTDIKKSPEALFGISAGLFLDESMRLTGLSTLSRIEIPELSHSLQAECSLENRPSALVNVKHLSVSGPVLNLKGILQHDIETGIALEAKIAGFNLKDLDPPQFDMEKFKAQFDIREMFKGNLEISDYDAESEKLDIQGQINLKLDNLAPMLPATPLSESDLKGFIDVKWDLTGRVPKGDEVKQLNRDDISLPDRLRQTEFLKKLRVITSLNNVSLTLPLGKDSSIRISRIQTDSPLELVMEDGLKKGNIGGNIELSGIEEIPSLGKLDRPANISLAFSVEQEDLKTARFTETISLDLINMNQSASVSLDNIDRILANKSKPTLSKLLKMANLFVSGKIQADIDPNLEIPIIKQLTLKGLVEAGTEIKLAGGESLKIRTWAESPGLDASLGSKISVINMQSSIDLEKSYHLIFSKDENPQGKAVLSPLSLKVINPESESISYLEARADTARRIMDDLQGRLNAKRSLYIEMAEFPAGTLPLKIYNHEMEFRLVNGLPRIDYFQVELLGGTLAGYVSLSKRNDDFLLEVQCSLSNLNASGLLPDELKGISGKEAELSGRLSLSLPVSQDSRRLFQELSLNVNLTHIGARTLERMLYAMDPYESNETIVQQRKLLTIGSPRWIRLLIENGNLSLSGQLEAKGISIDLPPIERLNLTNLPVHRQLEKRLTAVGALNDLLKIISSDSLYMGDDGIISWTGN